MDALLLAFQIAQESHSPSTLDTSCTSLFSSRFCGLLNITVLDTNEWTTFFDDTLKEDDVVDPEAVSFISSAPVPDFFRATFDRIGLEAGRLKVQSAAKTNETRFFDEWMRVEEKRRRRIQKLPSLRNIRFKRSSLVLLRFFSFHLPPES